MTVLPDEDDELDLPPLPPVGAGEDEAGPEDELDDEVDAGEESVGLDDAVGGLEGMEDEPLEVVEDSSPEDRAADELPALDLGDALDPDDDDDEYGWTGDDAVGRVDEFIEDVAEPELPAEEDRGEEGVEDAPALSFEGEDAVAGLPPLDRDASDELADDLELDDDAEIDLERMSSDADDDAEPEGP
ncbi:MAG: hypothetical protein KF901_20810 [Myxococcales bacterium]|nr:hypothetical protein [Myxococcales bacterium]